MRLTPATFARAAELERLGFQPADALHVAAAEALGADVLLSCEDRPLREQVQRRTGQTPQEHLLDGGYLNRNGIEQARQEGVASITHTGSAPTKTSQALRDMLTAVGSPSRFARTYSHTLFPCESSRTPRQSSARGV
jgi:hypothetical protein